MQQRERTIFQCGGSAWTIPRSGCGVCGDLQLHSGEHGEQHDGRDEQHDEHDDEHDGQHDERCEHDVREENEEHGAKNVAPCERVHGSYGCKQCLGSQQHDGTSVPSECESEHDARSPQHDEYDERDDEHHDGKCEMCKQPRHGRQQSTQCEHL